MKRILIIAIAVGFLVSVLSIGFTARAGFKPPKETSEIPVVSGQWDFDNISSLKSRVNQSLKRYQANEEKVKWVALSVKTWEYDAETGNYKIFGQPLFGNKLLSVLRKSESPKYFWVCKNDFPSFAFALTYVKGYDPVIIGLIDESFDYIVAFGNVREQW